MVHMRLVDWSGNLALDNSPGLGTCAEPRQTEMPTPTDSPINSQGGEGSVTAGASPARIHRCLPALLGARSVVR